MNNIHSKEQKPNDLSPIQCFSEIALTTINPPPKQKLPDDWPNRRHKASLRQTFFAEPSQSDSWSESVMDLNHLVPQLEIQQTRLNTQIHLWDVVCFDKVLLRVPTLLRDSFFFGEHVKKKRSLQTVFYYLRKNFYNMEGDNLNFDLLRLRVIDFGQVWPWNWTKSLHLVDWSHFLAKHLAGSAQTSANHWRFISKKKQCAVNCCRISYIICIYHVYIII